jgi:hypothetical protein
MHGTAQPWFGVGAHARLARIEAGETDPEAAAVDGHVPLAGRNAVSRHGPRWLAGCAVRSPTS